MTQAFDAPSAAATPSTSSDKPLGETAALIAEIEIYCRGAGIAETTFGRNAVNDGKFVARLRQGGRLTTATQAKVHRYIAGRPVTVRPDAPHDQAARSRGQMPAQAPDHQAHHGLGRDQPFRFYDNRQKYLLFVHTCSEKWAIAERAGLELNAIDPRPPALRVFDAGVGDGTVLTRTMRHMHQRLPTVPFYVVGKEISLEDVRLTLEKMSDRFFEHPATVVVLTNLHYSEAPYLMPRSIASAAAINWREIPLKGNSSHEFDEQIQEMQPFLSEGWQVKPSAKTGNPTYVRPSVLVLYREDHRLLLDPIIPKPGRAEADFDFIIASQPYRARMALDFKVGKILAPLVSALAPGGRLLGIHSFGDDPGLEIIRRIWPGEDPFIHNRHDILSALKRTLGSSAHNYQFRANSDERALFRYHMHTLPSEVGASIGTSTLFAAWNAATYVAQIEDERLNAVLMGREYLEATQHVLQKHGGLWFNDESYVISRRRD